MFLLCTCICTRKKSLIIRTKGVIDSILERDQNHFKISQYDRELDILSVYKQSAQRAV